MKEPEPAARPESAEGVLREDTRAALARVCASDAFRGAAQLQAFLTFVVAATLDGREREIKGYTIATQAFGRGASFDPQADPIVRVEAMRLRRSLDSYYEGEGAHDPVRIRVPRGTYVPTFARRAAPDGIAVAAPVAPAFAGEDVPERPSTGAWFAAGRRPRPGAVALAAGVLIAAFLLAAAGLWRLSPALDEDAAAPVDAPAAALQAALPTVEVMPIEIAGELPASLSASALSDRLVDDLARFDELVVVNLSEALPLPRATAASPMRYELSLRLEAANDTVMAAARLTHAASGEVIWANEPPAVAASRPGVEVDLARAIATTLAQPYGVIFADLRARGEAGTPARCLIAAYDYWPRPTQGQHLAVRQCLEEIVADDPHFHLAHAALTFSYLEEYRAGFNKLPGAPLDRALAAAQRAVGLAPQSARAQQAKMAALFMHGDTKAGLEAGRRAVELNPNDSDILASVGARYITLGRYAEGSPLLERAYAANPARPPWYNFFLFLAAHMQGDADTARRAAGRITSDDYALGLVARLIAAQQSGDDPRRTEALRRLLEVAPEVALDTGVLFTRRAFAPAIVERLSADLRRAGVQRRA